MPIRMNKIWSAHAHTLTHLLDRVEVPGDLAREQDCLYASVYSAT